MLAHNWLCLWGVSGVASFITTDERLQQNRGCYFLVHAMLPEGFPFHQFNFYVLIVVYIDYSYRLY